MIRAFSHLEGAEVAPGASVGPYARLRPGAVLGEGARVGNFVEVKNAVLGAGAKANHLTYLGDSEVGAGANIGAGTITCNYDGFAKHRTAIGAGAFIGSNTALVAPVTVGEGAIVGAGSTITKDVAADSLAVAQWPAEGASRVGRCPPCAPDLKISCKLFQQAIGKTGGHVRHHRHPRHGARGAPAARRAEAPGVPRLRLRGPGHPGQRRRSSAAAPRASSRI